MSIITVKLTDPDNDTRVVLWERNSAHPGGEAFIAGSGVFKVAETPAVSALLRSGRIEKVEAKKATPKTPPKKDGDEGKKADDGKAGEEPPKS